ncbi:MAG: hypothetical protein ACRBDL_08660 [Alphaproteobacteria bacterium]
MINYIKHLVLFILFVCSLMPVAIYAQDNISEAPKFFSALPDIPLMEGMGELEERVVIYDKPEGRIIEAVAVLNELSRDEVLQFYRMTLPQFGWGVIKDTRFFRRNEFLDISFEDVQGKDAIRILIRPTR